MLKIVKEYLAKDGAQFGDERAKVYGPELERLTEQHGGELKPAHVVQAAKSESSPLHDYFDWDIKRAAEKHWIVQAGELIRSIKVICKQIGSNQPTRQVEIRLMHSVCTKDNSSPSFVTIDKILSDNELRIQVLQTAINELNRWKEQYKHLEEFFEVCDEISKLTEIVVIKKKKYSPNK